MLVLLLLQGAAAEWCVRFGAGLLALLPGASRCCC